MITRKMTLLGGKNAVEEYDDKLLMYVCMYMLQLRVFELALNLSIFQFRFLCRSRANADFNFNLDFQELYFLECSLDAMGVFRLG